MRLIGEDKFRVWAASRGLLWQSEWPQRPQFGSKPLQFAWPWPRPQGWTRHWWLAEFILAVIEASSIGQSGGWYLWPHNGEWRPGGSEQYYRLRNAMLRGLGVQVGEPGAAYFSEGELDSLAAAAYAGCFMFDDCQGTAPDQFHVFPDHGQIGLYFVDEEMVWVLAATKKPLELFNNKLRQAGWDWLRDDSKNDLVWPAAIDRDESA